VTKSLAQVLHFCYHCIWFTVYNWDAVLTSGSGIACMYDHEALAFGVLCTIREICMIYAHEKERICIGEVHFWELN
jgi:hypothetical protein